MFPASWSLFLRQVTMQLLLVSAAVLACLAVTAHGHCFPGKRAGGKSSFDASKFSGEWLLLASAKDGPSHKSFDGMTCWKLKFNPRQDGNLTKVDMEFIIKHGDGNETVLPSKAHSSWPGYDSSMRVAWKKPGKDFWGTGRVSIIATDYDQYGVTYFTKDEYSEERDAIEKISAVNILSRTSSLDEKVLATLKSVVKSLNLNEGELKDIDTSGC